MSFIVVSYRVYNTLYNINKVLRELNTHSVLGFDVETRSIYTQEEIKEAKALLKKPELVDEDYLILVKQVARSSGLSCPKLIRTTHFVFGLSEEESIILIAGDEKIEAAIWKWVAKYKGTLLVHNTGFDFKICYDRTGVIPSNFEDTQLLAKTFINNAKNWKAKTGLKILVGDYYQPEWALFENYNPKSLNDKKFLDYAAIDGAAVCLLWRHLNEV